MGAGVHKHAPEFRSSVPLYLPPSPATCVGFCRRLYNALVTLVTVLQEEGIHGDRVDGACWPAKQPPQSMVMDLVTVPQGTNSVREQ